MAHEASEIVIRRLQRVGRVTYAVSLPKSWVAEKGLRPGDSMEVSEEPDGSLKIKPLEIHPKPYSCTINAELCRSPSHLARILAACYRAGYDSIEVTSASKDFSGILKSIKENVTGIFPGLEIAEEGAGKIIIRSVIDHSRYQLDDLLKRVHLIASTIFNNLIDLMGTRRYELVPYIADLRERALEILQLHTRLSISYFKKHDVKRSLRPRGGAHIYSSIVAAELLHEVIDDLALFAEEISRMRKKIWEVSEVYRALSQLLELASKLFDDALTSYFSVNFDRALHILGMSEDSLSKMLEEVMHEKSIKDPMLNGFLAHSTIFFRNLMRKCSKIAQLTLDMFVELENPLLRRT